LAKLASSQKRATRQCAVTCLTSTLDELTVHLRFPREPWQRIWNTNLLERAFGETRRRPKVIGRLPDERSCLTLIGQSWTGRASAGAG
jgi:transposase-like protein